MIRSLLDLIGHQPYPAERPYLWVIGREWSALYPSISPEWYVRVRPRSTFCRAKLLLGTLALYCDRDRGDMWKP